VIGDATFRVRGEVEVGGGLFGPPSMSWHREASVVLANEASLSASRNRVKLDIAAILEDEETLASDGSDLLQVGDWHSHPGGSQTPSQADLRAFTRALEFADARRLSPRYLALIVTADRDRGWARPQLAGWVVSRQRDGQLVCEPATVRRPA
jgi:proteasome lid subunit RPN8/RPN11